MKRVFLVVSCIAILLLTGCARIDTKLEEVFFQKSGIATGDEYKQYQQLLTEGKLDDSGAYKYVPEVSDDHLNKGKVHVTFAENRYMEINYYQDAAKTIRIDPENCYLVPGKTIYSSIEKIKNSNSNSYRLSEFRIITYLDLEQDEEFIQSVTEDGLVFRIPENANYTELSIIPIGEYPARKISTNVFYTDKNGQQHTLISAGTWYINGKQQNKEEIEISSVETYILKFDFDQENYFYVGSTPECFTEDPSKNHEVEFWEATPTDKEKTYSVELREYLSLSIKTNKNSVIKLNDKPQEVSPLNKTWKSDKIKYGDVIIVETEGSCTVSGDYQYIEAYADPIANGKRYTLKIVPEGKGNAAEVLSEVLSVSREFDITVEPRLDHCNCTFKLDGEEQRGLFTAREGQKLSITCEITDDKYVIESTKSGIKGTWENIFNKKKKTVTIEITEELDGKTIYAADYFKIVKKEE